ncbi:MAG: ABC transporter ATP-binding protein [Lentisphaeria bacterium]|nr:ABC transporter ATP-binding protein [Lentisphaeria bacterium]
MGITAEHLVKCYGRRAVVDDLSFTLETGCVLGFIGPNGAGKTTTMRMLCGVHPPTSGRVLINGIDPAEDPVEAKRGLGYLPENAPLYGSMSAGAFLAWCGRMHGLSGSELEKALRRAMDACALNEVAGEEIESLSKGYRRRVCLAQSIIHSPSVLVMDEPTDGLDPNQKREIRTLIRTMREHCAIIVSTHILEEIDAVCDRVLAIRSGRQGFSGTVPEFRAVSGGSLEDSFTRLTLPEEGAVK